MGEPCCRFGFSDLAGRGILLNSSAIWNTFSDEEQEKTKEIFCSDNNSANKLGIPTEYCGSKPESGNQYVLDQYIKSYGLLYGTDHPDLDFNGKANGFDFSLIQSLQ